MILEGLEPTTIPLWAECSNQLSDNIEMQVIFAYNLMNPCLQFKKNSERWLSGL